jgi:GTP pyrophosphokinase
MSTVLKSGDQVEVLTNPKQKPKDDWMKIVVTSKARAAIRDAMKEEYKTQTQEGKEIVKRKLKQMKLSLNDKILNELRAYFDMTSITEFYFQVGSGQIDSTKIKQFKDLKEVLNYKQRKFIDAKNFEREISKIHKDQGIHKEQVDQLLIGEDMDVVDYVLAKCCNPIPGDEVFGFVTVSEGIKIHRTKCPNSVELMSNYGYRVVKARWTSQQEIAFLAGLAVSGTDRVGLINDVTEVISKDLKVNMRSMSIETVNGVFEGKIQLYVNDTNHLEDLIGSILEVPGIVTVNRFDTLSK